MNGGHKTTGGGTDPARGSIPPSGSAAAAAPTGEPERLLRLPQALAMTGLGRTAWLNMVRSGEAPQPIHIGRAVAWPQSEVQAFIRDRIRQSRGVQ